MLYMCYCLQLYGWGTSMYYVSTRGGGRGSAKCLLLLTWGEGGVKTFAYVIIFCKKNWRCAQNDNQYLAMIFCGFTVENCSILIFSSTV